MTDKSICIENIVESCVTAMKCPRGKYYPDKNFGSHILEHADNGEEQLLAYARQAVSQIDAVYVKSVEMKGNDAIFTLLINDRQRQVTITL